MRPDDTVLMAYVDGDLPAERRAEVEAAVARSPETAARLSAIRASVLPYRAAFDRQALPPVPAELARRIGDLTRGGRNSRGRERRRHTPLWLAAAFAAGVIVCWVVLKLKNTR